MREHYTVCRNRLIPQLQQLTVLCTMQRIKASNAAKSLTNSDIVITCGVTVVCRLSVVYDLDIQQFKVIQGQRS